MGLISRLGDGPPPPTPDEVREVLARVVPARSIMDRLLEPVRAFVRWIFDRLPSPDIGNPNLPTGGVSALGYLIIGVLVVVLIGAMVLVALRWVRLPKGGEADEVGPTVTTEELDDPGALAIETDRLLEAGRFRETLLATYRQCVAELVVLNRVPRSRSRTTGELRADVAAGLNDVSGTFGELTGAFEDAWFGAYEVNRSDVEAARTRGAEVTAAAKAAGRAPSSIDESTPVEVVQL